MSSWPDMEVDEHTRLFDDLQEKCRSCGRYGEEYWHARRAFLTSYRFREEPFGFKEKLKRSVKGVGTAAAGVLEGVRHEVSSRRVGARVFRVRVALASLLVMTVRCFTPWLGKRALLE